MIPKYGCRNLFNVAVTVLMVTLVSACVQTKSTYNASYLPEFVNYTSEEDNRAGTMLPLEGFDRYLRENAEELAEDNKIKMWRMFWLTEPEIIIARSWFDQKYPKPRFSNFLIINLNTGQVIDPDQDEIDRLTEILEQQTERRDTNTAEDTAKTIALTFLSVIVGSGNIQHFDSYEGEIRNTGSGASIFYTQKIHNRYSEVTFKNDDGDKFVHTIHVPRTSMSLAPQGKFVYFPHGYLINIEEPNLGVTMWTGYRDLVTSALHPSWRRIGMIERNEDGTHILRITNFVMPEEEL